MKYIKPTFKSKENESAWQKANAFCLQQLAFLKDKYSDTDVIITFPKVQRPNHYYYHYKIKGTHQTAMQECEAIILAQYGRLNFT